MQTHRPPPRISRHAVDRYRQRVEPVDAATAAKRLAEMTLAATRRPTPRWWTEVAPAPGLLFLYPHCDSDVCLVMRDNTIITVISRMICTEWRAERVANPRRLVRRPPYRRPSPGSWPWEAA
jgi:hypothetical protein